MVFNIFEKRHKEWQEWLVKQVFGDTFVMLILSNLSFQVLICPTCRTLFATSLLIGATSPDNWIQRQKILPSFHFTEFFWWNLPQLARAACREGCFSWWTEFIYIARNPRTGHLKLRDVPSTKESWKDFKIHESLKYSLNQAKWTNVLMQHLNYNTNCYLLRF